MCHIFHPITPFLAEGNMPSLLHWIPSSGHCSTLTLLDGPITPLSFPVWIMFYLQPRKASMLPIHIETILVACLTSVTHPTNRTDTLQFYWMYQSTLTPAFLRIYVCWLIKAPSLSVSLPTSLLLLTDGWDRKRYLRKMESVWIWMTERRSIQIPNWTLATVKASEHSGQP